MAEVESGAQEQRRRDDELCRSPTCAHRRADHTHYGLCKGLGDEATLAGRMCGCTRFEPPPGSFSTKYSTYTPPPPPPARKGFSLSSSRNELGEGETAPRPNLQHQGTVGGAEPEWVIFGVRNEPGRVTVYASTKISYFSLRQQEGHFDNVHRDLIEAGQIAATPWDFKGRMVDYVKVTAPTYQEALRSLFEGGWHPDGEPTTADLQRAAALEEARREAEPVQEPRRTIGAVPDEDDDIVDAEIVEEGP